MPKEGLVVVTNAISPFDRHNISILSLPPGASYHFRYPKEYVGQDALKHTDWERGLLIVRDKASGGLLPVRWLTGAAVEDFGEFLFLDLRLGSIFDLRGSEEATAWTIYREPIEKLLPAGTTNLPAADLRPLVFPGRDLELGQAASPLPAAHGAETPDDHVRLWLAAISRLGQLDAYKDDNFYVVSQVYFQTARGRHLRPHERLSGGRSGYKLASDRVYFMELVQATVPLGSRAGQREELTLSSPAGHIQDLRTSWAIDGPYDRARLFFYVLPQEQTSVPSVLVVSKRPTDSPNNGRTAQGEKDAYAVQAKPLVPPTLLEADVVWSSWRWLLKRILPVIAVIAGLALFFLADHIAEQWPLRQVPKGGEYLRYISVFAIGWALNSLSSFVNSLKVTTKGQT